MIESNLSNPQADYEEYRSQVYIEESDEEDVPEGGNFMRDRGNALLKAYKEKESNKADDFETAIQQPSHYQGITITGKNGAMTFEAIEIIDSVLNHLRLPPAIAHAVGDALKYILRLGHKASDNASTSSDLQKTAQDAGKSGWYMYRAKELLLGMIDG